MGHRRRISESELAFCGCWQHISARLRGREDKGKINEPKFNEEKVFNASGGFIHLPVTVVMIQNLARLASDLAWTRCHVPRVQFRPKRPRLKIRGRSKRRSPPSTSAPPINEHQPSHVAANKPREYEASTAANASMLNM